MADGEQPRPGGWNRIHLIVDDIDAEMDRLTAAGVTLRNEVVTGPGGSQVLAVDPSGNFVSAVGPASLAASTAPLATVVKAGSFDSLAVVARAGGAVAALGVLLSLMAGVSRTVLAMAPDRELPAAWRRCTRDTRSRTEPRSCSAPSSSLPLGSA